MNENLLSVGPDPQNSTVEVNLSPMSPKLLQTYPHIVDRRRIFDIIKKPSAINLKFTYLPLSKSKCHFFSGAINCCLGNQIQNDTFFPPINCCLSNFQYKQNQTKYPENLWKSQVWKRFWLIREVFFMISWYQSQ